MVGIAIVARGIYFILRTANPSTMDPSSGSDAEQDRLRDRTQATVYQAPQPGKHHVARKTIETLV